jgi:RNA polymerase sigma-70 factor, ECF subfamily
MPGMLPDHHGRRSGGYAMGLWSRQPDREHEGDQLRRIARGDEEALERFYESYFPRLYRYIFYRVSRDHHHTEEVVNDTFMEAIRKADQYDPARGSVEAWLITLSRNRIRSLNALMGRAAEYEKSWSMVDGELEALFADLDSRSLPESALESEELKAMVGATMSSLPETYAKILEMKYIRNMSVRDMAATMKKTEKSVESQLTRARISFREAFQVIGGGMPAA